VACTMSLSRLIEMSKWHILLHAIWYKIIIAFMCCYAVTGVLCILLDKAFIEHSRCKAVLESKCTVTHADRSAASYRVLSTMSISVNHAASAGTLNAHRTAWPSGKCICN